MRPSVNPRRCKKSRKGNLNPESRSIDLLILFDRTLIGLAVTNNCRLELTTAVNSRLMQVLGGLIMLAMWYYCVHTTTECQLRPQGLEKWRRESFNQPEPASIIKSPSTYFSTILSKELHGNAVRIYGIAACWSKLEEW
jgi:hypothetical protein